MQSHTVEITENLQPTKCYGSLFLLASDERDLSGSIAELGLRFRFFSFARAFGLACWTVANIFFSACFEFI